MFTTNINKISIANKTIKLLCKPFDFCQYPKLKILRDLQKTNFQIPNSNLTVNNNFNKNGCG